MMGKITSSLKISFPFILGIVIGLYLINFEIVGNLYVGLKFPISAVIILISWYILKRFKIVEFDELKLNLFYFCCGLSMATVIFLFINPNWNGNQRDWKIILGIGSIMALGRVCYAKKSDILQSLLISWTISIFIYWILNFEFGWRSSVPSSMTDIFPIVILWIFVWVSNSCGLSKPSELRGNLPAIEVGVILGCVIFWLEFEAKTTLDNSAKWIIAHICFTILVHTIVKQSKIPTT